MLNSFVSNGFLLGFLNEFNFFENFWYIAAGKNRKEQVGLPYYGTLFEPKPIQCLIFYYQSL